MNLTGYRILIVEDEPLVAQNIAVTVRNAGAYVVGPAGALPLARQLAEDERLDAAILDVRLGQDDISPVANVLKLRGIPFVLHTGDGDSAVLNPHWQDYIIVDKPASEASLLDALEDAMAG